MSFYVSLGLGFFTGIAAVFGFKKLQKTRSQIRIQRAIDNAMLAYMNKDDLSKLLPRSFFPPWVNFPDMEKVNWLNMQLKELWPYVNRATQAMIREQVEPMLKEYQPALISSLTFRKLTLGTRAPELRGVKVLDTPRNEIVLLIDFLWAGNPSIILEIRTIVGVPLQVQVKDFFFAGVFRIALTPLVDELPCFGAVLAALSEKPKIKYQLKVVGGDISSIPGLQPAIDGLIQNSINDALVWPARILVPVIPGDYKDLELHPVAVLDVLLVEAKVLDSGSYIADVVSKSVVGTGVDPFAKLYVRTIPSLIQTSGTCTQTTHPLWGHPFEFTVEDKQMQKLTIEVWDSGELRQRCLGRALVELSGLRELQVEDLWVSLREDLDNPDDKPRGQVHLEVTYRPLGPDGQPLTVEWGGVDARPSVHRTLHEAAAAAASMRTSATVKGQNSVQGVVMVKVVRGKDLVAKDSNGRSDPFVTLNLLQSPDVKKKSRVMFKTLDPEWDESFEFHTYDARREILVVRVFDHDILGRSEKMGWCAITLTRVVKERVVEQWFELEDVERGRIELQLQWRTVQ